MKKYKIIVNCDYVQGHLRYGHGEIGIEASTLEEAKQKGLEYAKNKDLDIYVDDYELDDYSYNLDSIKVVEREK